MKTFIFSALVDAVFSCALCFFAAFTILLSFKVYRPSAAMFAVVAAVGFAFLIYYLSARRKTSILSKDNSKPIKLCMHVFNVRTYDENLKFFASVFNKMHISASITDEHITLSDEKIVVPYFYPSPVDANRLKDVTESIKNGGATKIVVLSDAFTEDALIYAKSAYISVFDAKAVYDLLKNNEMLPDLPTEPKPKSNKSFFTNLFVKNNGVRFIIFGLSLIAMAFIAFYPVYYYISGGVFVLFGLVSLIFAKPVNRGKTDLLREICAE